MDAQLKVMDMVHKGKTELAKMQQKERESANSTSKEKGKQLPLSLINLNNGGLMAKKPIKKGKGGKKC